MKIFNRNNRQPKAPVWTPEGKFVLPHADGSYDPPTVTIDAPIAGAEMARRRSTEADAAQLRAEVAERVGATAVPPPEQQ